jgi:hypothetical protein
LSTNPAAPAAIAPHKTSSSPKRRQHEHVERVVEAPQLRGRGDAVECRHPDVHQNKTRAEDGELLPGGEDRRRPEVRLFIWDRSSDSELARRDARGCERASQSD